MANFNTYQTRHFYVANAIDSAVDTAGDIYMGTTADKEYLFFKYMNGDGILTRTDLIKACNITSVTKAEAADMDTPLAVQTIALDATVSSNLSNYVGKAFTLTLDLRQLNSYDSDDTMPVTVSVVGTSTNTASASAFYNELAAELVKAKPKWAKQSYKVYIVKSGTATEAAASNNNVSSATGIVLIPEPSAYRRGIMSKDVFELTYSSRLHDGFDETAWAVPMVDGNSVPYKTVADVNAGLTVSISPATIPSVYVIADLEHFAYGERGDQFRGYLYPANYEPTYMIDLSKTYDVLTIEYYWQGGAENVQKSPRMIQIAADATGSVIDTLYDAVEAAKAGVSAS